MLLLRRHGIHASCIHALLLPPLHFLLLLRLLSLRLLERTLGLLMNVIATLPFDLLLLRLLILHVPLVIRP